MEKQQEQQSEQQSEPMAFSGPEDEWVVKVVEHTNPADAPGQYEASLPFRRVISVGTSEAGALGGLVKAYAEMARLGEFDPRRPHDEGAPIIQHVIEVLGEHLRYLIAGRRDDVYSDAHGEVLSSNVVRRSEAIAAVGTAIAALGRIKEA